MIIECPSCKTKFSLGAQQLAGVANPRFHCSRCGNVFGSKVDVTGENHSPESIDAAPGAEQLALIPDVEKPISFSATEAVKSFCDLLENQATPSITATWPDARTDRVYEADMRETLEKKLGTSSGRQLSHAGRFFRGDSGITAPAAKSSPATYVPNGTPATSAATLAGQAAVFSKNVETEPTTAKTQPQSEEKSATWFPKKFTEQEKRSVVHFRGTTNLIDDLDLQTPTATRASLRTNRHPVVKAFVQPVATFCAPPLVVALALLLFGESVVSSEAVLKPLARIVPAAIEKAPPAGLELVDMKHEFVTLENGSRVLEISGKIQNATELEISELKLEATLFDEENRAINTLLLNPNNGLMGASKIDALREDAILALQDEITRDSSATLGSGEVRSFRIVFTSPDDAARWFTTRVYSVTPKFSAHS